MAENEKLELKGMGVILGERIAPPAKTSGYIYKGTSQLIRATGDIAFKQRIRNRRLPVLEGLGHQPVPDAAHVR